MAQSNSRKGGNRTKKRPELRTGGGRQAKAERAERRRRSHERSAGSAAPLVRMRPGGPLGAIALYVVAWLGVALLMLLAQGWDRWWLLSYPDSAWLFASFGVVSVAPAVGRVSRTVRDADSWGAQALLVPAALLAVEAIAGPGCPTGGNCAAIGARGGLGLVWSFVLVVVLAAAAWALARWQQRAAADGRPARGRVRWSATLVTLLVLFALPGAVIGAAFVGLDWWVRDTPALVRTAAQEAERSCYGLEDAPELAVRAAPNGYSPTWTTFAVRRADESRPGIGKKGLPSNWATLDYVHPYEATVSFSGSGELVSVSCRRLGPGTGNATADDLTQGEPDSNPLSPKTGQGAQFYPQLFTNPTTAASQIAEREKAAKAKAKKPKAGAK
jgi:hypothetical protein